jgi:PAS domain S-box-containing protein
VNSIDVAQSKANKQMPPLIYSSKSPSETNDYSEDCRRFLEELGLTSQQFQTLFDNLPQGIAVYKVIYNQKAKPVDFIPIEKNRKYNEIHFFNMEQLGQRATESNPKIKTDRIDWIGLYGKVATTGKPENFEILSKSKEKWYQIYIYSPQKTFSVSVFMDITEQKKRAIQELEQQKKSARQLSFSEKKYRRLFETTRDGIMARDVGGKMIDCNVAYAKMLGYSKKELRNLSIQELLPKKWHKEREKIIRKVLQTGRSIVFEREYVRKDGSVFPASVRTWRLYDGKNNVIGIWSIVRDITEQKERQKDLQAQSDYLRKVIEERTKQLKDSERLVAIGQTAGMVGHDLRNPLQTIIGELFLAKNEVKSLSDGEVKNSLQESIHTIEDQALYMDKIVSDLQVFVQPVKIDKKPINLKKLIEAVLASVVIPTNILVLTQIEDYFPQIKADIHLLKRVFINLVTNSVQAMPDGGKLTLHGQVNSEDRVSITVQDTGVGIPDEIKKQIFTPLFTTKPHGQGFGLAVCKRVIEAHGGNITFESTAGKGAKFLIQLPVS